ncbi:MAG: hypothetical protein Q7R49_06205 [Candidatus Daviesbacteria bacterium]|nr:hypothetical protein [Candidatus Daviesbacteria bacterium]
MDTKSTILSQNDLALLEEAILRFGRIVSFDNLASIFSTSYGEGESKQRISLLSKRGWLVRIKRGLYIVITDIATLGFSDISELIISQTLNKDSYISFENALQYYSMFDQMLSSVEAVTDKRARNYQVQDKSYRFSHIKKTLYFGFTTVTIEGREVKMAEKEKALLDMLYFRGSSYTVDLVLEKLSDYKEDIDFEKLKNYAKKFGLSMIREIGFLLDLIKVDTKDLYLSGKIKEGYSKMSVSSSEFNARWRLYYDRQINISYAD